MNISKTFYAANRNEWQAWLEKHHNTETEVWLLYYKKYTGRPNVAYNDSVEEALCYGWIDSIIQKIDDEKYTRKFTPRKSGSRWSALNKRRAAKLIREGRMTDSGQEKLDFSGTGDDYGRTARRSLKALKPPPFLKKALMKNRKAWIYFQQLAPSHKRNYIVWVSAAKKEETCSKRIKEAMRLLSKNKKLGMK